MNINNPWEGSASRYPEGAHIRGRVISIVDYGCVVEVEEGIEGFVFVSEMDWVNTNIHPSHVVSLGDDIEVEVLSIDEASCKLYLGIKQYTVNPWETFARKYSKQDLNSQSF